MKKLKFLLNPRLISVFFLGFSSGLPLLLTLSTLFTWLSRSGIDRSYISMFQGATIAYSIKFLWSFFFDYIQLPYFTKRFGKRSSWLILIQIFLILSILLLGFSDPVHNISLTVIATFLVTFLSSSQDIVLDAYRIEILKDDEQEAGAAMNTYGYRTAMFVSGGGALFLADKLNNWHQVYYVMAMLIFVGVITVLVTGEPKLEQVLEEKIKQKTIREIMKEMVIDPFVEFTLRDKWVAVLLFIFFFKIPDSLIAGILSNFYVSMGFSNTEIAIVVKTFGPIMTLIGIFIGWIIAAKIGTIKTLLISSIFIPISNLIFILQNHYGNNIDVLYFAIGIENLSGALSHVVIVGYLSSLCNKKYTATQFALLSSIATVSRTVLSMPTGYIVNQYGWDVFFIGTSLLGVPALFILLYLMRTKILIAK